MDNVLTLKRSQRLLSSLGSKSTARNKPGFYSTQKPLTQEQDNSESMDESRSYSITGKVNKQKKAADKVQPRNTRKDDWETTKMTPPSKPINTTDTSRSPVTGSALQKNEGVSSKAKTGLKVGTPKVRHLSKTAIELVAKKAESLIFSKESSVYSIPIMDIAMHRDGQLCVPGNRILTSLNLSHNKIGSKGFQCLLKALEDQTLPVTYGMQPSNGLKRLVITRNEAPDDDPSVRQINRIMSIKDPMHRIPLVTLDKNVTPCSLPQVV